MRHSWLMLACAATVLFEAGSATATPAPPVTYPSATHVKARTCKQVASCEEAVQIWCDGYRRADGDGDGIPCENICRSKEQVDEIRTRIGC
nr:excalibur calcium-binding domain-containing protein [Mesorhizobium sp.]